MRNVIVLAAVLLLSTAAAAEPLPGPVTAEVVRVIDGDTIEVRAMPWPRLMMQVAVRLRGVDTPEMRGECAAERHDAAAARDALAAIVGDGPVVLTDIDEDKYAGRIDARVIAPNGGDVTAALLKAGHGRAYDGGRRGGWCG